MTLARSMFVSLAFAAKNHNLLTYNHPHHPQTRTLPDLETQIKQGIASVMETIEKKEHTPVSPKRSHELQSLKKLAIDLRKEFDGLKK